MTSPLTLSRTAGILFLLQLVPYYLAHEVILGHVLYTPDFLTVLAEQRSQVGLAVVLELLSAFSFVGFTILLFPMLKRVNYRLSVAYLGIRLVEFGLIVFSQVKITTLAKMGELYNSASDSNLEAIHLLAVALRTEWVWIGLIYMIIFSINALVFYWLIYRSFLLPSFIALWGMAGAVLALFPPLLLLFNQPGGGMFFYLPIGLNELFLALWLIVRGWNETGHRKNPALFMRTG